MTANQEIPSEHGDRSMATWTISQYIERKECVRQIGDMLHDHGHMLLAGEILSMYWLIDVFEQLMQKELETKRTLLHVIEGTMCNGMGDVTLAALEEFMKGTRSNGQKEVA